MSANLAPIDHSRAPAPRPKLESFVRLRRPPTKEEARVDARRFLETLGDDLVTLDVNLEALDGVLDRAAYDASVQAAARAVRARLDDMRELRDALCAVHAGSAHSAAAELFLVDSPLADYLRGVSTWCIGVVRALEAIATELSRLAPDWATLRARLDSAAEFFVFELTREVRSDLGRFGCEYPEHRAVYLRLAEDLEALFGAADWLSHRLSLRFG